MSPRRKLTFALAIAAISGFVALSYEIVWYRVLAVMTRGTSATFGLLLGAYLAGLAIGSRVSTVFCEREGGPGVLRVLSLFVAGANVVAALVAPAFAWSARFTDYRLGLAVLALGAALLGSVLPLASHFGIEADDRAGSRLSYVYLANIVGSACGSLVTGFVLMDALTILGIARLLVVAGFGLSAVLLAMSGERRAVRFGGLIAAALACFLLAPRLYDRLYERLVYKAEFDGTQRFADVVENRSGVITVTSDGTIYGGGGYDGVLNTSLLENDKNGIIRAYLVGALHPHPRNVLMVGLSGGAWAEVVVNLPGVEKLTVVEINPGYVEVVKRHPEVSGLLTNPKLDLVIDDGRRWLLRHPDRKFDFIVMNTTQHWRDHATNLLSREFMDIARRHLAPGGVFYFNTTESRDVQLTAARTFPHALRVSNFMAAADDPFTFDRDRWKEILRASLDLSRPKDREVYDDLAGYNQIVARWAILEFYGPLAGTVTDDNMLTEWKEPLRYPELP